MYVDVRKIVLGLVLLLSQSDAYGMQPYVPTRAPQKELKGPQQRMVPKLCAIAEESDLERLKRQQATAQRQLLQAIFIFLQLPFHGEVNALKLCLAGKNVFLEEHLCPEIKAADRWMYGRDLDPELDDTLKKLFGDDEDEYDRKYPDDFKKLERQNFNPCLFRLVEEYEQVALEIDAQQQADNGKEPVKVEDGDSIAIACSLYILYATFVIYLDNASKEHIQNVIGEYALYQLGDLSSRYNFGSFLAIAPAEIDFLIQVNEALLNFFLQDLKFEKPRVKFEFQVLSDEQATFYVRAKKYWVSWQKKCIGKEFLPDFDLLRAEIQTASFLHYRRQEIFYHACKDYDIRLALITKLHKMFEGKSLARAMSKLSVSAKDFVSSGEMAGLSAKA